MDDWIGGEFIVFNEFIVGLIEGYLVVCYCGCLCFVICFEYIVVDSDGEVG